MIKRLKQGLISMIYRKAMGIKWLRKLLDDTASLQECLDYWRNPPPINKPINYVEGNGKSQLLLDLVKEYATEKDKLLEIGCNAGRNLNTLYSNGYKELSGIEICTEALELLKQIYPSLNGNCQFYNMPVENIIRSFPDNEYNVIYTLAVLEHIHTDSEWIFHDMVRVSKDLIITVEDEVTISWRHFPRNYKKIFEQLGMEQVREINCEKVARLSGRVIARVFKPNGSR